MVMVSRAHLPGYQTREIHNQRRRDANTAQESFPLPRIPMIHPLGEPDKIVRVRPGDVQEVPDWVRNDNMFRWASGDGDILGTGGIDQVGRAKVQEFSPDENSDPKMPGAKKRGR